MFCFVNFDVVIANHLACIGRCLSAFLILFYYQVKAYLDRKSLAHSLNDTKTAVMQLHNLVSVIVIIISIIVTLLLMGIATTKVLVVVSSQLLVVVFIFGNACKTVFEALIFVFIMHPFDVGDRCVIDGTQVTSRSPFVVPLSIDFPCYVMSCC
jgi:small-conductance mechanosensitive channel